MLICLFCFVVLGEVDNGVVCFVGYCFDCVCQGYLNLLLVQYKKSFDLGDNVVMVEVCCQFFGVGYYVLLVWCLVELVVECVL